MISKSCVVLCCLLVGVLAEDDKYTDKYDNTNVQEILGNKRLTMSYVNCILDKGKCTADGKELRDNMQDALETGCKKCTERQREGVKTVINHLIKNEPEIWKELTAKFDPKGQWRKEYEEFARKEGITIPEE